MAYKHWFLLPLFTLLGIQAPVESIEQVLAKTRSKIDQVKDYEASGKMKTNVAFLKLPISNMKVYFKKPNKFKLKTDNGISFVPKGSMSLNLNSLFSSSDYTLIDAGTGKIGNTTVRIAKLLPNSDNSDLVLTTLYIDPVNYLILESKTTTKEEGTYALKMKYGKYAAYALPDEILFSFNTKDYKLPKGITFDFDDGTHQQAAKTPKTNKGEVLITFSAYLINKGLSDAVFK